MNITLTIIAQALSFAILIWFTAKFVWPPLLAAIESRQKTIADGLADAERAKHDLDMAAKRSADILREAKDKAGEIVASGEKRASEIVEQAKAQAKVEGDRIVAGAKAEVEQEVFRAKEQLRTQVSAIALAGAGKILGREIDAKAHNDLLDKLAADL
ncbi:F0F1 ATP synthase subunit B [Sideroxydans sp. CL21]|jgi:F-type H+-transporting ATPase subunit b|uniref:F0F1 ATP synthase subunit B n=1 Tax=Sideroxydans sp. CL21 TaxID=2600596 RepID=UPI0024BCEA6D|nr:F0F1 ATP synthase subunit B [Sideroxydans sp. CL21]